MQHYCKQKKLTKYSNLVSYQLSYRLERLSMRSNSKRSRRRYTNTPCCGEGLHTRVPVHSIPRKAERQCLVSCVIAKCAPRERINNHTNRFKWRVSNAWMARIGQRTPQHWWRESNVAFLSSHVLWIFWKKNYDTEDEDDPAILGSLNFDA